MHGGAARRWPLGGVESRSAAASGRQESALVSSRRQWHGSRGQPRSLSHPRPAHPAQAIFLSSVGSAPRRVESAVEQHLGEHAERLRWPECPMCRVFMAPPVDFVPTLCSSSLLPLSSLTLCMCSSIACRLVRVNRGLACSLARKQSNISRSASRHRHRSKSVEFPRRPPDLLFAFAAAPPELRGSAVPVISSQFLARAGLSCNPQPIIDGTTDGKSRRPIH